MKRKFLVLLFMPFLFLVTFLLNAPRQHQEEISDIDHQEEKFNHHLSSCNSSESKFIWPSLDDDGISTRSSSSSLQTEHEVCVSTHQHHHSCCGTYGVATLRGRRPYQEDRLLCAPQVKLPSLDGSRASDGGLFGVFDGHRGDEASDFAAKYLKQHFLRHVFNMIGDFGKLKHHDGKSTSTLSDMGSNVKVYVREILEEALRKAILDMDSVFLKKAAKHDLQAGSTAIVALHIDGHVLVANVGDSKAFVCSSCTIPPEEIYGEEPFNMNRNRHRMRSHKRKGITLARNIGAEAIYQAGLCVKELSTDHQPDRSDERARIEAAGGVITKGLFSSLSRVNGQLAVSRSIGDIHFKKYGVISDPELSGWQQISGNDSFLVLASDGIFERLSPQDVCSVLHAVDTGQDIRAVLGPLEENSQLIALPPPGQDLTEPDHQVSIPGSLQHSHTWEEARQDSVGGTGDCCNCFECEDTLQNNSWSSDAFTMGLQSLKSHLAQVMAQAVLEVAYRAGSMDNLSVFVIPLKRTSLVFM